MKTIKRKTCASLLLRESYELLELESGLKVVLYQDPTASSATACFAVHYGSTDNRFIPKEGEEPICVPEGIAHYLEHKLFEDENGDAFARFSETGASANAFTSGDKTVFYFTATDRFEENLTILLDFVSTPYFTRETVEKEQGIIAQEIGMYDDNPFWQSYFLLLQSLYHHHSIRIDTAGSVESIRQITPELLHRCYDLFYRPQNMVLTAAGNFNRDRLLELCQTLLPKRPDFEVIRMPEEEPYPVRMKRAEKKMPVSKPLFTLGIKMLPEEDKEKRLKKYVLACVATECLFGESSPFYREMYDAGVINSCFDCSVLEGDGYLAILCDGETEQADPKIGHVMCFWGLGDHGGGPFREEIDWILQHKNDFPGVEFRFSHPDAYFEAVRASGAVLPVHEGELQHHAIGCYSAYSRIKREVRKTENTLINLDRFLTPAKRKDAWKKVLFATFHDIHAGSSVKSGYADVEDSLGTARDMAYEAFLKWSRRKNQTLPPAMRQRIIFDNPSAGPFRGFVTFPPSLAECWKYGEPVSFYDTDGTPYPVQQIPSEESTNSRFAFIFPLQIPPRARKILELDYEDPVITGSVQANRNTLKNDDISVKTDKTGIVSLQRAGVEFLAAAPEAVVYPDPSDTWTHSVSGYTAAPVSRFRQKGKWQSKITGPLYSELVAETKDDGGNTLNWYCGMFDSVPGIRLRLRLNWHSPQQLLKLHIKPAFNVKKRIDGIPGALLERALNGEEYPVFNRMTLAGNGHTLTLISSEIFSADVQPDGTARLTLVRSPHFAHHDPYTPERFARNGITDLGEHDFTLTILPDAAEDVIAELLHSLKEPVYCSETTFGMSRRYIEARNGGNK